MSVSRAASHGTYGGFQWHIRAGEEPCEACRQARNGYMAEYRRSHQADYEHERRMSAANSRALWRLAKAHPDEFRTYLDEERAK